MAANKGTFTTSDGNELGEQPKDGYFSRNGAWLRPVLATALLLGFYGMAPSLDLSISLPAFAAVAVLALGGLATGLGLLTTNTLSSYLIVRGLVLLAICYGIYTVAKPVAQAIGALFAR